MNYVFCQHRDEGYGEGKNDQSVFKIRLFLTQNGLPFFPLEGCGTQGIYYG